MATGPNYAKRITPRKAKPARALPLSLLTAIAGGVAVQPLCPDQPCVQMQELATSGTPYDGPLYTTTNSAVGGTVVMPLATFSGAPTPVTGWGGPSGG